MKATKGAVGRPESPQGRFKRLAISRVNKLLESIEVLENLAQPGSYRYTKAEANKIFVVLERRIRQAKLLFQAPKNHKRFSF